MVQFQWTALSDDEKKLIVEILATGLRGFIDITAEDRIKETLDKNNFVMDKHDTINFYFTFTTITNDLLAALGVARKKIKESEENKHGEKTKR